jgi:D-alanyl-D-alanine carboxypeptidase
MTDLRVLQEGRMRRTARERRRRRLKRRRRIRRGVLALLALGVVLLGLEVGGVGGSGSAAPTAASRSGHAAVGTDAAARAHATAGAKAATAAPSPYGRALASVQVRHPHLQLGLRAGLLFDIRTGHVMWQRQATRELPIASLTKMMTALVVAERSKPSDRVLITSAATHFTGSGVGLLPLHKHVRELALLYGLLLPSGNDAAIALAQHVAGNQRRFIALMNAEAGELHLSCTHFTTVSGVVDDGNHSCAADLAVMAHDVLSQPLLKRIVATRDAVVRFPIKGGKLFLYNNNPLLRARYPGAVGVKTGYTERAGLCIVVAAHRGRTWLGVVLLHSGNWLTQAETLLNDGFAAIRLRDEATGPVSSATRQQRSPATPTR